MPYPAKLLNPDESVALDLNPHWWYFAESVSSFAVSGILWLFVFGKYQDDPKPFLTYPIGVIALATLVWVIVRYLKWRTTYFVITSDRLIYRHGVIGKAGIEIPLERVNNVNFTQTIIERMIGVGDLLIESGGKDGQQTFSDISQPERVQNIIHSTIQNRVGNRFEGAPSMASVAAELERLEALRDRGTLNHEEFEEQKRRILG